MRRVVSTFVMFAVSLLGLTGLQAQTLPTPTPVPTIGGRIVVSVPPQCTTGTTVQIIDVNTSQVVASGSINAAGLYDTGCVLACKGNKRYVVRVLNPNCVFVPSEKVVNVRCSVNCSSPTKVSFNCDCAQQGGRLIVQVPPNCAVGTTVQITTLSGAPVWSGPLPANGILDTGCKLKCPAAYVVKLKNANCTFSPSSAVVQVPCCPNFAKVAFKCQCAEPRGRIVVQMPPTCAPNTTVNIYDATGTLVASGPVSASGVFDTKCTLICPGVYTVQPVNPNCTFLPAQKTVEVACCPETSTVLFECTCEPPKGRIRVFVPRDCTTDTVITITDVQGVTVASGPVNANGVFDTECTLPCPGTYTVTAENPNCLIIPQSQQVQVACCPDVTDVQLGCRCDSPKGRLIVNTDCPPGTITEIIVKDDQGNVVTTGTAAPNMPFDTGCTLPCTKTYTVEGIHPQCEVTSATVQVPCCDVGVADVVLHCNCEPPKGRIKVQVNTDCTSGTTVTIQDATGATVASGPVNANGVFDTGCTLTCPGVYVVTPQATGITFQPPSAQVQVGCCPDLTQVSFDCEQTTQPCTPPPADMVAWWPLDEPAGATSVVDIVGSVANNGTPKPNGSAGGGNGPNPVTGMVGGALYFFSNHFVEVPHDSTDLDFGTGSFTIDAWVNVVPCGPGWYAPIVDKYDYSQNVGYRLGVHNSDLILTINGNSFTALGAVPSGSWQHVAATVFVSGSGNSAVTLYVNGSAVQTWLLTSSLGSVSNSVPLWIGYSTPSQQGLCEIAIDELELFKRALTQAEIAAIYNAGPAGKCRTTGRIWARVGPWCLGMAQVVFNVYDANQNLVLQGTPDPQTGAWLSPCTLDCTQTYTVVPVSTPPLTFTPPSWQLQATCCPGVPQMAASFGCQ